MVPKVFLFENFWTFLQKLFVAFSKFWRIVVKFFMNQFQIHLWKFSGSFPKNNWFKVVVRACYGAYFVVHVFKYLAPNLFSGDLHDAVFQSCCAIECGTFNCPRGLQLPTCLSNY